MPFIPSIDRLAFVIPKRTSCAISLLPEGSAWITTLSPTFKSFRVAAAPLFSNLVLSLTSTVTDCLEAVSTVMEFSEMLLTLPIRCFSFPWASAIRESANVKATTVSARFIVSPLNDVDALMFWVRDRWVGLPKLFFFLFLLEFLRAFGVHLLHQFFLLGRQLWELAD